MVLESTPLIEAGSQYAFSCVTVLASLNLTTASILNSVAAIYVHVSPSPAM